VGVLSLRGLDVCKMSAFASWEGQAGFAGTDADTGPSVSVTHRGRTLL